MNSAQRHVVVNRTIEGISAREIPPWNTYCSASSEQTLTKVHCRYATICNGYNPSETRDDRRLHRPVLKGRSVRVRFSDRDPLLSKRPVTRHLHPQKLRQGMYRALVHQNFGIDCRGLLSSQTAEGYCLPGVPWWGQTQSIVQWRPLYGVLKSAGRQGNSKLVVSLVFRDKIVFLLYTIVCIYGPLTRYVNLWVAHAHGIPGTFFLSPTSKEAISWRSRHASRHVRDARVVMHVGITNPRWRGKRSRHSRRMCNPQFYVSDKRLMLWYHDHCCSSRNSSCTFLGKTTGEF